MWNIIIPIITFIVGIAIGGFAVSIVFKKQMTDMQADPKQIQAIARGMGMNLSQKQMNQITRQMQNSTTKKNTPKNTAKPVKKK